MQHEKMKEKGREVRGSTGSPDARPQRPTISAIFDIRQSPAINNQHIRLARNNVPIVRGGSGLFPWSNAKAGYRDQAWQKPFLYLAYAFSRLLPQRCEALHGFILQKLSAGCSTRSS